MNLGGSMKSKKPLFVLSVMTAFAVLVAEPIPQNVPELMTTFGGEKVNSLRQWEEVRAPELLKEFLEQEYGLCNVGRPEDLRFEAIEPDVEAMEGRAIRKRIRIAYSGKYGKGSFAVTAFIPKQKQKVPSFLLICNRDPEQNIDPTRKIKNPFWPAEEIVARGYAAITFFNGDVAPDVNCGNRKGVFACFESPEVRRADDAWGTLAAWAWGASRVMDWIESEPLLDAAHVAVVGHSRGGKTALLAGVTDKRFAMACSNNSGCSGAKLNHIELPRSEHVRHIMRAFSYWFCTNYAKQIDAEKRWRVDQHAFIALMAPRLVCVASASQDYWAGPLGEWWAAKLASPAWELYGKKGLTAGQMPPAGEPQQEGCVSYHLRDGKHLLTPYDWKCYMDFADRHGWRNSEDATSAAQDTSSDRRHNPVPAIGQNAVDVSSFSLEKKGPRILLVGNSITLHGPRPEIGWTNNCGMAASAREKDYVHLMRQRILSSTPEAQICVMQVADTFERSFFREDWRCGKEFEWAKKFKPDVVMFFFGANVPLEYDKGVLKAARSFGTALEEFRDYLDGGKTGFFYVEGFFNRPKLNAEKRELAKKRNDFYIGIDDIRSRSDVYGQFNHPNDKGMQLLADRFFNVINEKKELFKNQ